MKKFFKYTIVFVTIVIGVLVLSFFLQKETLKNNDIYTLKINERAEKEWYYEVYLDSELIIKQETIPGVPGIQSFKSKEEAKKVGTLVITKLKSGTMPMISLNELKKYDITFKK
ncbi:DUF4907 domain-containing protein [Aquimarina sp. AD1]|uniref:DUF4907 domain-containing protein n=1 Tax=Aquimarina sp. (strain AD1) TaxID=1714848 RepID=UPI000E4D19C6|nr:DUF4907 domain-containing protein [Aquimarina sp. AD1]AXT58106.1 DUF4907 domain-containing protein [Aquimarina sp. AD1]RKN37260.1 DUF4907 domain-containing protein [Aquimarina sp. AD1]